jgi:hypothetical protein
MAFDQITQDLAVASEATAAYQFWQLPSMGSPTLICRHAGDSTPGFRNAWLRWLNIQAQQRGGRNVNWERLKEGAHSMAKIFADHCVVSWDAVETGATTPAPCTPAKVHEFLCAVIDAPNGHDLVWSDFRNWIRDRDNFVPTPAPDLVELGKR